MKGLEELLLMAFDLQQTDDDLQPCCNKPKHKVKFLRKAMTEAARVKHEEHAGFQPGAYFMGPMPPLEKCWAFPCRIIQEFGPEKDDE